MRERARERAREGEREAEREGEREEQSKTWCTSLGRKVPIPSLRPCFMLLLFCLMLWTWWWGERHRR